VFGIGACIYIGSVEKDVDDSLGFVPINPALALQPTHCAHQCVPWYTIYIFVHIYIWMMDVKGSIPQS
jgi:hypothetical protein